MRRSVQKPKRYFKPKKVKEILETFDYYAPKSFRYMTREVDVNPAQWNSYGGYNHTNRDRSGGHLIRYKYENAFSKRDRLQNIKVIQQGLTDFEDEIHDCWLLCWEDYEEDFFYEEEYSDTEIEPYDPQLDDWDYFDPYY